MPLRTILSIATAVSVATWAYSGVVERLNRIETRVTIDEKTIEANTEFRIRWPRGEMGALPADNRQDMLLESIERHIEDIRDQAKENREWINNFRPPAEVQNAVMQVQELQIRLRVLESQLETLREEINAERRAEISRESN